MHSRLDPPERIVVQHFHVRTLYPEIYLARTRRALPPDPAGTQPRCIIPASGYYEWRPINGEKQPYYFSASDAGVLSIAGPLG
jgi:SOS response associated peptidase (SRAP)